MNKVKIKEWISQTFQEEKPLKKLRDQFLSAQPFEHLELYNFFNKTKIKELLNGLRNEEYEEKDADLFSLLQTQDLNHSQQPNIKEFTELINSAEFLQIINEITGIILKKGKTDCSSHIFRQYDYLLCHDDLVDSRKIAFVLNLSNKFTKNDGGALQLFCNKDGSPVKVAKSIVPIFNNFVIFKVSPISFHQVQEVYANKKRVTISGWFHE